MKGRHCGSARTSTMCWRGPSAPWTKRHPSVQGVAGDVSGAVICPHVVEGAWQPSETSQDRRCLQKSQPAYSQPQTLAIVEKTFHNAKNQNEESDVYCNGNESTTVPVVAHTTSRKLHRLSCATDRLAKRNTAGIEKSSVPARVDASLWGSQRGDGPLKHLGSFHSGSMTMNPAADSHPRPTNQSSFLFLTLNKFRFGPVEARE